jgi:hypothetical protein
MEKAIEEIKKRISLEENVEVRVGLKIALLIVYDEQAKELTESINKHLRNN